MKVSIIFTDTENDSVNVKMVFDPAITDEIQNSPAFETAMVAFGAIKKRFLR